MSADANVVRFELGFDVNQPHEMPAFVPERIVPTSQIGIWIAIAAILWAMIAISTRLM